MADTADALAERLKTLGFNDKTIKESLKNKKLSTSLVNVLAEAGIGDTPPSGFDASRTTLFATLSTLAKDGDLSNRAYISKAIREGKLKSTPQIEGGWSVPL